MQYHLLDYWDFTLRQQINKPGVVVQNVISSFMLLGFYFKATNNKPAVVVQNAISSFGLLGFYSYEGLVTGYNQLDMLQNYCVLELIMRMKNVYEIYNGALPYYTSVIHIYMDKAFIGKVFINVRILRCLHACQILNQ